MEYKTLITHPSCSNGIDGKIQLYISNYSGKLYINWLNLPSVCKIINNGKTITGVCAGQYIVELEDKIFFGNNKKIIKINVIDPPELKIDFLKINQPKCYYDTGSIDVFVSGGTPPYSIYYDKIYHHHNGTDCYSIDNIQNGTKHKILIKDKNGCSIETSEIIHIFKDKPEINIDIIEPSKYGYKDSFISIQIKNIINPKIAWYKLPDIEKPIAMNVTSLKNELLAGEYLIKIVDDSGCITSKKFIIKQPDPLSIKYKTTADYASNSFYSYRKIKRQYNSLLIPNTDEYRELYNIEPGDVIRLKNKKADYTKYKIILQPREIVLENNKIYKCLPILPCISSSITQNNTIIKYKEKEYKIFYGFNKNIYRCYISASFIILDNEYNYAFKNNDLCDILINGINYNTRIKEIDQKYNLYDLNINNTIIFIDNSSTVLYELNKNLNSQDIYVRSLDTTAVQKKGSIFLDIINEHNTHMGVYNINNSMYRYKIVCFNKDKSYYNEFYTNKELIINGLSSGEYTIILDNQTINFLNGYVLNDNNFMINIDSRSAHESMSSDKHKLPKFKILPTHGTGLFINIAPYNQKFILIDSDNKSHEYNSTYNVINNMQPGKYMVRLGDKTKDIYITKNQILKLNSIN